MNYWRKIRYVLLITVLISTFVVLAKSLLSPFTRSPAVTTFVFPSAVPLIGWQRLTSHPLFQSTAKYSNYVSGMNYQYTQKSVLLDIEMRYVVDTVADIKNFIKNDKHMPLSSVVLRQQEEIGFYGLFTYQEKAYLSTCINPRGGSTVTDRQFKQNRNIYDLQLNRLIPWLLGQEELKDERCLWVNLSIPLKDSSPESAYQMLETVFFSWYHWWYRHFPKL